MAGPHGALQDLGEVRDIDGGLNVHSLGVHDLGSRHEDHVDAGVLKLLKICVRGPGVGLQVVLVVELQRVDENGRNGMVSELLRLLYEGDVPGVEIAHGCNNGNRLVLLMILTHGLSYRLNILCYYHNCSARLLAGVSSEKGLLPL